MTREQQIAAEVAARYGCPVPDAAVQMLPVGKSSWQAPVWDPKTNQLRYPDAEARKRAARDAPYIRARKAPVRAEEIAARRAEVARMHAEGVWSSEIARRLGVNPSTISTDLFVLGLEPVKPPTSIFAKKTPYAVHPAVLARNARIAELAALGWTADQIGLDVGFSRKVVRAVAAKLGIEIKHPERPKAKPRVKAECSATRAAILSRRAEVRRLIEAGHYMSEVSRILCLSNRVVALDVKRMGLQPVSGVSMTSAKSERLAMQREQQSQRRARVQALYNQGMTVSAIAAEVGVHVITARKDLRALGFAILPQKEALMRGRSGRAAEIREAIAKRDDVIRDLVADGLTQDEIASRVGLAVNTVRRTLARLGLRTGRVNVIEIRRQKVAKMRAAGATLAEITAALGISSYTVTMDIRALGLVGEKNAKAERQKQVERLRAEGMSIRKMAEALRVSHATISVDIAELGLAGKPNRPMKAAA
ncbi:hypothetical protein GCM10010991_07720 [Gemmobacter aquaticus]|uniref:Homeodomain-like domain-containing protein n=1 Tax=Gemmobacter aquaticus TaxID=490185 RepID=A0A917YJZ1_9RHOB|nr:helix-turn-helix domain-containing protein [Gemmobacter aquaticus]GGO26757.1 hypothetical protein GCM10010991_07720 [Gemmobacter aquaticus]